MLMKQDEILYPCNWSYKVIGTSRDDLYRDIKQIMSQRSYSLEDSRKNGKYISLNLSLTVDSKMERNLIFQALKSSSSVKMVI